MEQKPDFINNQEQRALFSCYSAHRYSEVTTTGELLPVKRAFLADPYINSHLPPAYLAFGWLHWCVRYMW